MTKPLPPGWAWSRLGDVAAWGSGGTPKRTESSYYNGDIPWAVIGDLHDGVVQSCKNSITEIGLANSNCKILKSGTLLVAMYGSIGKLGITGMPMATNQAIAFAMPYIDNQYLYNYLLYQRSELGVAGKGATQKNISQTVLKVWPIPIAPITEQRRIVDAIEEHFSRIDAVESAAQTALAKLDTLRRTVLTAAFSGRLVEPPNSRHTPDGLPEEWHWSTLVDVAKWGSGGTPKRTESRYYGGDIPWAVIGDLNDSTIESCKNSITEIGLANSNCKILKSGTLLVAMYGSIGKLGITGMPMATNQAIAFALPHINIRYLFYYLLSQRRELNAAGKGATQKNISQTVLKAWLIPVAPQVEQERIVAAIEEHFSRIDTAKVSLERCLRRCSLLRRAVLAAAFSGRLVEQDPNDEPASALLERIAAEQPERRTRRKSA